MIILFLKIYNGSKYENYSLDRKSFLKSIFIKISI